MSGTVVSNVFRTSGVIAATAAGISFESTVTTGTTLSVEAGKGYFINTSSNICTVTLPSSAATGDQIILVDFARTWGTYSVFINSNGLNFQGQADTYTVEYNTSGATVNIIYSGASKGWTPISDDVVTDVGVAPPTQKAIFAFGNRYIPAGDQSVTYGMSNLVNSSGVVAADVAAVGGISTQRAAATYGFDRAIFAFGNNPSGQINTINLISNQGVVASDSSGTGSARLSLAATTYGTSGTAVFAYGIQSGTSVNKKNLVSNTGSVASDSGGVGTARHDFGAAGFGSSGQGIFAFGYSNTAGSQQNVSNIVSNTGVIASNQSGVGTARSGLTAAAFGGDKCIFGFGSGGGPSNIVSNTGVVASDVSRVGTDRIGSAGVNYGGTLALFQFGANGTTYYNMKNLVSSSGVIASDASSTGTIRANLSGAGYSTSA